MTKHDATTRRRSSRMSHHGRNVATYISAFQTLEKPVAWYAHDTVCPPLPPMSARLKTTLNFVAIAKRLLSFQEKGTSHLIFSRRTRDKCANTPTAWGLRPITPPPLLLGTDCQHHHRPSRPPPPHAPPIVIAQSSPTPTGSTPPSHAPACWSPAWVVVAITAGSSRKRRLFVCSPVRSPFQPTVTVAHATVAHGSGSTLTPATLSPGLFTPMPPPARSTRRSPPVVPSVPTATP